MAEIDRPDIMYLRNNAMDAVTLPKVGMLCWRLPPVLSTGHQMRIPIQEYLIPPANLLACKSSQIDACLGKTEAYGGSIFFMALPISCSRLVQFRSFDHTIFSGYNRSSTIKTKSVKFLSPE